MNPQQYVVYHVFHTDEDYHQFLRFVFRVTRPILDEHKLYGDGDIMKFNKMGLIWPAMG